MSDWPHGSTWEGNDGHKLATIWLERGGGRRVPEIWHVSWTYMDGSGGDSDWFITYKGARAFLPFPRPIRMKQTK